MKQSHIVLKRTVILVIIVAWIFSGWPQILSFPPKIEKARAAAFANGYSFRRLIDITDAQVSAGPHTNFPILVSTTLTDIKTTGNGGDVTDAEGDDIIFTDSDGTTQLAHEVEKYVATTGELIAWVRVPSLSATSQVYIYYGNAAITAFQGNVTSNGVTGVWDANFKGVWHLPNGTTLGALDSTSNAEHGTISGTTAASGQIDEAASFDGSGNIITMSGVSQIGAGTISAWINPTSLPASTDRDIISTF